MPYTHFRFIAYEVLTATRGPEIPPKERPVVSGFDAVAGLPSVDRIPVNMPPMPGNEHQELNKGITDARRRLKRLAVAVNDSERLLQVLKDFSGISAGNLRDDPAILKVFVVPEFYFRPPTKLGVRFHYNTYPDIVAMRIFKQLNTMFSHAAFEHWLIVAGTVLWNQEVGGKSRTGALNPVIYWNTAVWIKGGSVNGASIVEKNWHRESMVCHRRSPRGRMTRPVQFWRNGTSKRNVFFP
jgi:hypothetical protein